MVLRQWGELYCSLVAGIVFRTLVRIVSENYAPDSATEQKLSSEIVYGCLRHRCAAPERLLSRNLVGRIYTAYCCTTRRRYISYTSSAQLLESEWPEDAQIPTNAFRIITYPFRNQLGLARLQMVNTKSR